MSCTASPRSWRPTPAAARAHCALPMAIERRPAAVSWQEQAGVIMGRAEKHLGLESQPQSHQPEERPSTPRRPPQKQRGAKLLQLLPCDSTQLLHTDRERMSRRSGHGAPAPRNARPQMPTQNLGPRGEDITALPRDVHEERSTVVNIHPLETS